VTIAALAATRWVEYATRGPASLNLYATHLRFDGLLVGTALAYLVHFEPTRLAGLRRHPLATTVLGAVLALPMMVLTPDRSPWTAGPGLVVMYLGFAFVVIGIIWLEEGSARRLFASRALGALSAVGVFSYGIYLWHVDLAQTPMKKVGALLASRGWSDTTVWLLVTGAYLALAIAAGAALSRLIEFPMLALRDRWYPRADKTEVAPAMPAPALRSPPIPVAAA
jgi:peptidoglycan/LPS O-acetylase OafA/YrhL